MSQNEAVIEIDVGLTGRTKNEIDLYLEKLKDIKEKIKEAKGELGDDEQQTGALKKAKKPKKLSKDQEGTLNDFLGKLDSSQLKQLQGVARNPVGFVEGNLDKLLGNSTKLAKIAGPIGAAIAASVLFIEIMKALSVKGGPFNRDWRRFIANEIDVGISRELQKRKELGIDQVVIAQQRGFVPNNPGATYNSLYEVNENRYARIGLNDRAAGVTVG